MYYNNHIQFINNITIPFCILLPLISKRQIYNMIPGGEVRRYRTIIVFPKWLNSFVHNSHYYI